MAVPRLSVCADAQKVDRAKLAQTEFNIIEFDPETFRILLDYLHTGSCPLTCISIPGEFLILNTNIVLTIKSHSLLFLLLC